MKKSKTEQNISEIADTYNKIGRIYHESRLSGRLFNEFLEMPATWSLIPENLNHYTVLDAGCGTGIYAKEIAKRGAKVIGVDISETMLTIANEEKHGNENIIYCIGNLSELSCQNETIDLIICNYVLGNIKDIKAIFKEFFRVLKSGGQCIYSISHPIRSMAIRENLNNTEIWRLENYYDRTTRISDLGPGMKIKTYKRTISDYINTSIEAGFTITKFCEPQPIPAGEEHDPITYNLAMRLPQLLLIKMEKSD